MGLAAECVIYMDSKQWYQALEAGPSDTQVNNC